MDWGRVTRLALISSTARCVTGAGGADPPLLYVVLDEGVLHRPVGTPDVMAAQRPGWLSSASRRTSPCR